MRTGVRLARLHYVNKSNSRPFSMQVAKPAKPTKRIHHFLAMVLVRLQPVLVGVSQYDMKWSARSTNRCRGGERMVDLAQLLVITIERYLRQLVV